MTTETFASSDAGSDGDATALPEVSTSDATADAIDVSDPPAAADVAIGDLGLADVDLADAEADVDASPALDIDLQTDADTVLADGAFPSDVTGDADTATPLDGAADSAADTGADAADGWSPPTGVTASAEVVCPANAPTGGVWAEVAAASGVDAVLPKLWPAGSAYAGSPVVEGGGQAVADFDVDGHPDLYVVVPTGPDRLYLADAAQPWKFNGFDIVTKGTEETSATAADLDGDGDPDLVIGADGVVVLRNDGPDPANGVKWTDVTKLAGLEQTAGVPLFSTAVGDVDRDGWLDLLLAANKFDKPAPWEGAWPPPLFATRLLRGKGGFQFEDVTDKLPQPEGFGPSFISSLLDLDDDGDLDVYLTYDFGQMFQPNHVLRNDTSGPGAPLKFTDVSALSGADIADNPMGIAWGDYDLDGRMDLYVTGNQNANHLLHNQSKPGGPLQFVDLGLQTGTYKNGKGYVSWGAQFVDSDNKGALDLYVVNGKIASPLEKFAGKPMTIVESQVDQLWWQNDSGLFGETGVDAGLTATGWKRSVQRADFDGNGFVDLTIGSVWGPALLYRNGCNGNAWLTVRLKGKSHNTDGIGARVWAKTGGKTWTQDIDCGSTGLWGSSQPLAMFGLGDAKQVDQLTVRWPSGVVTTYGAVPVRRRLTIAEP